MSVLNPSLILSGIVVELDARRVVVTSGNVETFQAPQGLANVTQSNAVRRAAYVSQDAAFNGEPVAHFVGNVYSEAATDWKDYPLPNLSSLTEGEVFVVLASDYGTAHPNWSATGLWDIGSSTTVTHYPWNNGTVYDDFGTSERKDAQATPVGFGWTSPHIYNVRSQPGLYVSALNGADYFSTSSNNVSFKSSPRFGGATFAGLGEISFNGRLAYLVICSKVQTPRARALMIHYLRQRFHAPSAPSVSVPSLIGVTLVDYYARENASATLWPSTNGREAVAVSTPAFELDGYNFAGARVPSSKASSSGYFADGGESTLIDGDASGYFAVMGRFVDFVGSDDKTLFEIGDGSSSARIFYNKSTNQIRVAWNGTELLLTARPDTDQHLFEVWSVYGEYTLYAAIDGVQVGPAAGAADPFYSPLPYLAIGGRLLDTEVATAYVSRVVIVSESPDSATRFALLGLLFSLDYETETIESLFGANLREIWYAKDAAVTSGEATSIAGRKLAKVIGPTGSGARPAYNGHDAVFASATIDCTRTGRFLRNTNLDQLFLPAGNRPFVFIIGRLRTTTFDNRWFIGFRRETASPWNWDQVIGIASNAKWRSRLYNYASYYSDTVRSIDTKGHLFGQHTDSSGGLNLWVDGVVTRAQTLPGVNYNENPVDTFAIGANASSTESEDFTFVAAGICTNHPTAAEQSAFWDYVCEKYIVEILKRRVADSVSVADTIKASVARGRTVIDTAVIADQVRLASSYRRSVTSPAIVIVDSVRVAMTYGRRLTDSAAATDKVSPLAYRSRSDALSVTDMVRPSVSISRMLSNSIGIVDGAEAVVAFGRYVAADTIACVDSTTVAKSLARSALDACATIDAIVMAHSTARRIADAVSIVDQLSVEVRTETKDAISVVDSLLVSTVRVKTLADALMVSDAISVLVSRAISDSIAIHDAVIVRVEGALVLSDEEGAIDDVAVERWLARSASDVTSVTDSVRLAIVKAVSRGDAISVSDAPVRAEWTYTRSVVDVLALTERLGIESVRALRETATTTDAVRVEQARSFSLSDAMGVADGVRVALSSTVPVIDAVSVDDVLGVEFEVGHIDVRVSDGLEIVDSYAIERALLIELVDAVAVVDMFDTDLAKLLSIVLSDTIDTIEHLSIDSTLFADLLLTLYASSASAGPLFMGTSNEGPISFSSEPASSATFVAKLGDFIETTDAIDVRRS